MTTQKVVEEIPLSKTAIRKRTQRGKRTAKQIKDDNAKAALRMSNKLASMSAEERTKYVEKKKCKDEENYKNKSAKEKKKILQDKTESRRKEANEKQAKYHETETTNTKAAEALYKKREPLVDTDYKFLQNNYSKNAKMSTMAFWESSGLHHFPKALGKPNSDKHRPRLDDIEEHNKDPKGTEAFLNDVKSAGPTNDDLATRLAAYNKAIELTSRCPFSLLFL